MIESNIPDMARSSRKNYMWLSHIELFPVVAGKLDKKVDILLDIGCGIRPQEFIVPRVHICCEPFEQYITVLQEKIKHITNRTFLFIKATWEQAVNLFPEKSVDSVFLADIIEHLPKEESLKLLRATERIARRQIAVFTTLGFIPQCHPDGKDAWGLDGGAWQEHKSGWLPEDFDASWDIYAVREFHFENNIGEKYEKPFGAFWAIKNMDISLSNSVQQEYVRNERTAGPMNYPGENVEHSKVIQKSVWKDTNAPLISIMVPTYNQADYLSQSIESIRSQTYRNWEAVVVDDGSTDNTPAVLDKLASMDPRIRVLRKENGGTASALKEALKNARGEWVCWLSSDDLFEPDALETFATAIREHPEYKFFHSHFYTLEEESGKKIAEGPERYRYLPQPVNQVISFFNANYVHGISIAVDRQIFDKAGVFNEDLRYAQDVDMWMRISALTPSFFINKRTCITRVSSASGTQAFPEAGPIDVARLCLNFLNTNRFPALFPLLDLGKEDDVLRAVESTVRVAVNANAQMYTGVGYTPALIERMCEWLSCDCTVGMKNLVLEQLETVIEAVNSSSLPGRIKDAFSNIRLLRDRKFKYKPYEPLMEMARNIPELIKENRYSEADHIVRYLSREKHLSEEIRQCISDNLALNPESKKKKQVFPESRLAHKWLDGLQGMEIGPSSHNPFGLDTRNVGLKDDIYEKEQLDLTGEIARLDIISRADDIPVQDESEDFILTSHVIEHCPDLVKALLEWYRIVRKDGYIFMVVPHRNAAPSDAGRPLTDWQHVMNDYVNNATGVSEPEAGRFGHCHYHVFDFSRMKSFVEEIFAGRLLLVDSQEIDDKVGNGFTLVYKKVIPMDSAFPWYIGGRHVKADIRSKGKACCDSEMVHTRQAGRFVNICMITYNRLEFTERSIDSVVRHTSFPYVLTVVDNNSSDGTKEYLSGLHKKGTIKNLVLLDENVGVAKASNLAWSLEPDAEYYLKFDNDIVIQKDNWLSAMVEAAEKIPQAGAVAYSFEPSSFPAQEINGLHVRIKRGNLGGACILIPKRTERLLGHWNEDYDFYGEEDADYGLRITLAGLLNIYMEDESIGIHLPAGRAARIDNSFHASDGIEEQTHAEYRTWKDEQRRKNIELYKENRISFLNGTRSLYIEAEWSRNRDGMKSVSDVIDGNKTGQALNILAFTNNPVNSACPAIRLVSPLGQLQKTGHVGNFKVIDENGNDVIEEDDLRGLDLILMQRISKREIADEIFNSAAKLGVPVVYDIDDYLIALPEYNPFHYSADKNSSDLIEIIKRADLVTVSTEYLANRIRPLNADTYVLPNCLVPALSDGGNNPGNNDGIITFGIFGTPTHDEDVRMVLPAVKRILADYPGKVRFRVLGCVVPELEGIHDVYAEKRFYLDYRSYADYLKTMPVDAVLVPLIRNEFNLCKSNIKYLEYSACRLPGIYSDIEPYLKDITHGRNGLLAGESTDSWYECMKVLLEDRGRREKIAENARNDVTGRYKIEENAHRWIEHYQKVLKGKKQGRQGKASIIIPVFNNVDYTRQCLEALAKHTSYPSYEVIIVDNASTDGTKDFLKCLEGDVQIITNSENLGFARACNQGAKAASGDYIVFLNNDTIPQSGWLDSLVKKSCEIPEVAIVGSKLLYPDNKVQHAGVVFHATSTGCMISHIYRGIDKNHPAVNYVRDFNAVTAACMLVKREIFFETGMFDETFINGYEDIDFCLKVREKGYRIIYNPESVVYHFEEKTPGRLSYGEHNTRHFLSRWLGRIKTDDHIKALEDGIRLEYLPDARVRYHQIEGFSRPQRSNHNEKGDSCRKKIAIVRGASLNKWEMQNYEPLLACYDITAYTTLQTYHDIRGIESAVVQLPFHSQGIFLHMEGLEEQLADKDLVFSADITFKFSAQAVLAKKKTGCRVVCLEWENIPFNFEGHDEARIIKETVRNGADHFIAVTERAKEALMLEGVTEEKIDVIPMGIDLSRFRPDKSGGNAYRRKLGINDNEIIVLYIGRMVWEKGIYDFVHAAARILKDRSMQSIPVRFVMAGSGKEREALRERAAALGILNGIIFIENTPYEDMHKMHNLADIFVLPSLPVKNWQEQFGMVLIESMACGTPVISTLSGSIPEVVEDAGILVQPNDHLSLYKAMKRLVTDKGLRDKIGTMALARAREHFDSRKNAEKFRAVFEKVMSRKTREDDLREAYILGLERWESAERDEGFNMVCRTFMDEPDRKDVLDSIVEMGRELNRYEAVEKSLREYLTYHPADLEVLASLSETLFQLGRPEQAEEELRKILIFDPGSSRASAILDKIKTRRVMCDE